MCAPSTCLTYMTVTVVDYGAGNIRSVLNALAYTGADAVASAIPETVASADRIVLPGVGAAGSALDVLRDRGLSDALDIRARPAAPPFSEFVWACSCWPTNSMSSAFIRGLGWIGGRVGPIADHVGPDVRIPHIGWARIDPVVWRRRQLLRPKRESEPFLFLSHQLPANLRTGCGGDRRPHHSGRGGRAEGECFRRPVPPGKKPAERHSPHRGVSGLARPERTRCRQIESSPACCCAAGGS